ncbi:MAG: esterase/lipase family protein [Myxococcota bacterium]
MPDRSQRSNARPRARRLREVAALAWVAGLTCSLAGCALLEVAKQQEQLGRIVAIRGDVSARTDSVAPLVVILQHLEGEDPEDPESWSIVDYIVRERPGAFAFGVRAGTYRVGAYQDLNRNLKYDSGEPLVRPVDQESLVLDWGERSDFLKLVIEADSGMEVPRSLDIVEAADEAAAREQAVTLRSKVMGGAVTSLDDPRFTAQNGDRGLWRPADFLLQDESFGVFFLQEYDPGRVPVLFVHGIAGSPQDFRTLIGELDANRFQPWVYFYPSGMKLETLGRVLANTILDLHHRLGFESMGLVAHSMGGLVARSFIVQLEEVRRQNLVPLFISISTPFGGNAAAQTGADRVGDLPSNVAIPASFLDMAPRSEFLSELFYVSEEFGIPRPLPAGTEHHLVFGYQRRNLRTGPSSDGTIDLTSQLRMEAQLQATSRFGVDASHIGILEEPATSQRVSKLLSDAFR